MWQMIQKIVKPDIAKKQGRIRRKIGLGIRPFFVTVSGQRFRLGNLKLIIEFGITKEA